jgi:transcriptional regulator with XRE-family HTH domain
MATVADKNVGGRPPKEPGYWGRKVLAHASRFGLTYADMAIACGASTSGFGQWMAGETRVPSVVVERLADLFGVPTDELRTTPPRRMSRKRFHA